MNTRSVSDQDGTRVERGTQTTIESVFQIKNEPYATRISRDGVTVEGFGSTQQEADQNAANKR